MRFSVSFCWIDMAIITALLPKCEIVVPVIYLFANIFLFLQLIQILYPPR